MSYTVDTGQAQGLPGNESEVDSMMEAEKMKRYEVLTEGNAFLHGFDEWQDAVTYANSLDIHVKIWDGATGITTEWWND